MVCERAVWKNYSSLTAGWNLDERSKKGGRQAHERYSIPVLPVQLYDERCMRVLLDNFAVQFM